jgi:quinol-cytochrome oxidoreductase complex cytochrome b subunit
VLSLITVLVIFFPASLEPKADPIKTPEGIKPEWYFLWFYAFLFYVPPIIGVLAPVVGIILLMLLPFLDKNPYRKPSKRPVAVASVVLITILMTVLTFIGKYGKH